MSYDLDQFSDHSGTFNAGDERTGVVAVCSPSLTFGTLQSDYY